MKQYCAAILLAFIAPLLGAAEFAVPRMEMAARGRVEDGGFVLDSLVSADLALSGGYKYGLLLGFDLETGNLRTGASGAPGLSFRIAKATAADLFGAPLEMSFFLGHDDDFGTGSEFETRFGLAPFGTDYKGSFYFPDSSGGAPRRRYDGLHSVRGTGVSFAITKWEKFVPLFYLYENHLYGLTLFGGDPTPRHSADARFLLNREKVNVEFFGGATLAKGKAVNIRAGVMAHFAASNGMEFFFQGGVPGWDIGSNFGIDNLFFLMEPRLRFGWGGINLTFFYHPVEYLHISIPSERGLADINLKTFFGDVEKKGPLESGIEATARLVLYKMSDFSLWLSPFVTFRSENLLWDTKLKLNLMGFSKPAEMFEIFIGVRTAF
jgi:hypothetical protein